MDKKIRWIMIAGALLILLVSSVASVLASGYPDLNAKTPSIKVFNDGATCSVRIKAGIRNAGDADVLAYYVWVKVVQSGTQQVVYQNQFSVPGTKAGRISTVEVSLGWLGAGQYQALVTVDPGNQIAESNENNNKDYGFFTCAANPYPEP